MHYLQKSAGTRERGHCGAWFPPVGSPRFYGECPIAERAVTDSLRTIGLMKRSWIALALFITPLAFAQSHLEVKYMRDSAEYATAARQAYRMATTSVLAAAPKHARGS